MDNFNATPVFNAVGEHVANFAIYTDITERKKMGVALKENEKNIVFYLRLLMMAFGGLIPRL